MLSSSAEGGGGRLGWGASSATPSSTTSSSATDDDDGTSTHDDASSSWGDHRLLMTLSLPCSTLSTHLLWLLWHNHHFFHFLFIVNPSSLYRRFIVIISRHSLNHTSSVTITINLTALSLQVVWSGWEFSSSTAVASASIVDITSSNEHPSMSPYPSSLSTSCRQRGFPCSDEKTHTNLLNAVHRMWQWRVIFQRTVIVIVTAISI